MLQKGEFLLKKAKLRASKTFKKSENRDFFVKEKLHTISAKIIII